MRKMCAPSGGNIVNVDGLKRVSWTRGMYITREGSVDFSFIFIGCAQVYSKRSDF